MKLITSTFVVFLSLSLSSSHYVKPTKYLTNCFTEEETGKCESTWVKICGDYYACDLVVAFHTPIKRIGYIDDQILVAEGTHTYLIDERYEEKRVVQKTIPPWKESIDKKGNKYYPGDGTTYVSLNKTGQEIEILTTGEHSTNQLALDVHANKLFILTFSQGEHKNRRDGNLFAMNISPLPIKNEKIQAEAVKADGSITAMAVQGGLEKLLLGTRTKHGGKLIRLNRVEENPCSRKEVQKAEIFSVLSDATSKLSEFIDKSDKIDTHESGHLEEQYSKLKEEQNETNSQLNEFVSKVFSIDHKIKSKHHGHHEDYKKIDSEHLKDSDIEELKSTLGHLQEKLDKYSSGFDAIMNDPLIYSHRHIAVEEYDDTQ